MDPAASAHDAEVKGQGAIYVKYSARSLLDASVCISTKERGAYTMKVCLKKMRVIVMIITKRVG